MPISKEDLTDEQISMLKEALGVDGIYPFYRNFAAVSALDEVETDQAWQELVSLGLAQVAKEPCQRMHCRVYAVTDEGKRLISELTGIIPFIKW